MDAWISAKKLHHLPFTKKIDWNELQKGYQSFQYARHNPD